MRLKPTFLDIVDIDFLTKILISNIFRILAPLSFSRNFFLFLKEHHLGNPFHHELGQKSIDKRVETQVFDLLIIHTNFIK